MSQTLISKSLLYDQDFLLWTQATIAQLQNGNFKQLDIVNVIEEIDSLGKAQKNAFKGQIRALVEHILKRCYVKMPLEYHGWERTIRNIRPEIEDLLETSPSLQNDFPEVLDRVYQQCLKKLRPEYTNTQFPDRWPFSQSLADLLNIDFWEAENAKK
ncbi:MAG: DUF29 domain-containing protein [Snowella sp.]|nr:DUF29 domain-containing protein [Snowella sp.]